MRIEEVFVVGGQPTITYCRRSSQNYEAALERYLRAPNHLLSVCGPTKSGKTVLVKKVLGERCAMVPGGSIDSIDDFWQYVAFGVDVYAEETITFSHEEEDSWGGGGGVDFVANAEVHKEARRNTVRGQDRSRHVPLPLAVKAALKKKPLPIVVDDFHYIEREVQVAIVRGLKDLVFDGIPVIFLSVPHHAYDPVRAEREMNGRMKTLEIPLWKEKELVEIARLGFGSLDVEVTGDLMKTLAVQASGSPHLMQEFSLELCRHQGIEGKERHTQEIHFDGDQRQAFYEDCANHFASKVEFDRLVRGPQRRGDRKRRRLRNSEQTVDIYLAVFVALANIGPQAQISYDDIRSSLRHFLVSDDVPAKGEVTRVLKQLTDIAARHSEGMPVLEWHHDDDTLYITDPLFSFYLRWVKGDVR